MTGKKYDEGKLRWDLLPIKAVEEVVKVLMFGAAKYGDDNWQKLDELEPRYYAASMRHLASWRQGETLDEDSGLPALAHAVCDLLFLLSKQVGFDVPFTDCEAVTIRPGADLDLDENIPFALTELAEPFGDDAPSEPTPFAQPRPIVMLGPDEMSEAYCGVCEEELCECPQTSVERPCMRPPAPPLDFESSDPVVEITGVCEEELCECLCCQAPTSEVRLSLREDPELTRQRTPGYE